MMRRSFFGDRFPHDTLRESSLDLVRAQGGLDPVLRPDYGTYLCQREKSPSFWAT